MPQKNTEITSFTQLLKRLLSNDLLSAKQLFAIINDVDFIEDKTDTYNNLDIQVFYTQLPVVVAGDVLVKVVLLKQADNVAIVFPQEILDAYNSLTEEPELLTAKNTNFSLYAEVYGFDSKDPELQQLIKKAYLYAGNNTAAYELTGDLAAEKSNKKDKEDLGSGPPSIPDFEEVDVDLDDPNIAINMEAYSKFKKQTKALESLLFKLHTTSPGIVRENIKIKQIKNVLLIEVNNKAIYESLKAFPKVAKTLISEVGETIRTNKHTQLLDSFSLDNKRYFTVAEAVGNNFWVSADENLPTLTESKTFTKPIQNEIIVMGRSTIRRESRVYKPYKLDNQIVYTRR